MPETAEADSHTPLSEPDSEVLCVCHRIQKTRWRLSQQIGYDGQKGYCRYESCKNTIGRWIYFMSKNKISFVVLLLQISKIVFVLILWNSILQSGILNHIRMTDIFMSQNLGEWILGEAHRSQKTFCEFAHLFLEELQRLRFRNEVDFTQRNAFVMLRIKKCWQPVFWSNVNTFPNWRTESSINQP